MHLPVMSMETCRSPEINGRVASAARQPASGCDLNQLAQRHNSRPITASEEDDEGCRCCSAGRALSRR
jgi:hypothetical protein